MHVRFSHSAFVAGLVASGDMGLPPDRLWLGASAPSCRSTRASDQSPNSSPSGPRQRRIADGWNQYAGWDGSIWRTQALTPPPTWTASASPAPCTSANTSAERTPVLQ